MERTEWNSIKFNPDMSQQNVFCRSADEPLRILHEDEVHYSKIIWMPANDVASPLPGKDAASPLDGNDAASPLPGNGVASPLPGNDAASPLPGNDAASPLPPSSNTTPLHEATTQEPRTSDANADNQTTEPLEESFCQGSITRKRSCEMTEPTVQVKFVTESVHLIVDKIVSRKRKRN